MNIESLIFELSVIIFGAALLGTLFLYARQPIIIAYIAIGILAGPNGLGIIDQTHHIEQMSHFGVILLLFIIGINLQPSRLIKLFRKTALITFSTSIFFGLLALILALLLRFDIHTSLIFGAAMMFSSTVVGLKLIPTTTLHHRRTGEFMTSVLLLQDILAILVILLVTGKKSGNVPLTFALLAGKFALLCLLSFGGVKYIMIPLFRRFDVVQEYTFLAALGWCLLWAEAANLAGLSYEMGAFIAGLSIASCTIAYLIAEHLKPLREFFLILFFFAVGAELDFSLQPLLLISAVIFGIALVPIKYGVFRLAFSRTGESHELKKQLSVRLAQSSEFSLLVSFSALAAGVMSMEAVMVIQIATIVTFILSTYWVVLKYPTPISGNSRLRKD